MNTHTRVSGRSGRRGFTLVELAAVSATLGAGALVAIPLKGPMEASGLKARAANLHREIASYQLMYINDNEGAFTGPNTSGLAWNRQPQKGFTNPGIETLAFETGGGEPTSQGDWLTPLVGDVHGFSANRAVRMQQKYDVVADPFASAPLDDLFGTDSVEDGFQFEKILASSGYRQMSYLMMRSFTHLPVGTQSSDPFFDAGTDTFYVERFGVQNSNAPALIPDGYTPDIFNVGTQPANKAMFADGTRFLSDGTLDIDVSIFDAMFNNDGSTGPIDDGSVAYGRNPPSGGDGGNLELSFRKAGGKVLFVSMFDGSLRSMTREQAWTDPTPWYPSGSAWTGSDATPESIEWVETNLPGGIIP
mgnify:CR=1 FL=1